MFCRADTPQCLLQLTPTGTRVAPLSLRSVSKVKGLFFGIIVMLCLQKAAAEECPILMSFAHGASVTDSVSNLMDLLIDRNVLDEAEIKRLSGSRTPIPPEPSSDKALTIQLKSGVMKALDELFRSEMKSLIDWAKVIRRLNEKWIEKSRQAEVRGEVHAETKSLYFPMLIKSYTDFPNPLAAGVFLDGSGAAIFTGRFAIDKYVVGSLERNDLTEVGPGAKHDYNYFVQQGRGFQAAYLPTNHQYLWALDGMTRKSFKFTANEIFPQISPSGFESSYFFGYIDRRQVAHIAAVHRKKAKDGYYIGMIPLDGQKPRTVEIQVQEIHGHLSLPDGRLLAIAEYPDGSAKIIDISNDGQPVYDIQNSDDHATGPHSKLLQTQFGKPFLLSFVGTRKKARLIDISTGSSLLYDTKSPGARPMSAHYFLHESREGQLTLVERPLTGQNRNSIITYNLTTGSHETHELPGGLTLKGDETRFFSLKDGRAIFATAPRDNSSHLYIHEITSGIKQTFDMKSFGLLDLLDIFETADGRIEAYFSSAEGIKKIQIFGPLESGTK
jgi:hypothetical protein